MAAREGGSSRSSIVIYGILAVIALVLYLMYAQRLFPAYSSSGAASGIPEKCTEYRKGLYNNAPVDPALEKLCANVPGSL